MIFFEPHQRENTNDSDLSVTFSGFLIRALFFQKIWVYNTCLQLLSALYPKMKGRKLKKTVIEFQISDLGISLLKVIFSFV